MIFHRIRALWRLLGISIYNDGERRRRNLKTISCIAFIMEIPALFGAVVYFFTPLRPFAIGCMIYFAFNIVIFYLAAVKKNRELAVRFTVILALVASTNIALFARNGFAAHWTLLFPLVICYLCDVRLGILSSSYMTFLFMALYWTPLRVFMKGMGYPPIFFSRFPLFYLIMSLNTIYIMIEYHVNILHQILYERQLEAARDEAREANQAKSEFLASMSHEIRTPMNAVLGMNTIILRECQTAHELLKGNSEALKILENITSSAGDIENAGNNLLSLINQILDFSKIEAGKIEVVESNYKLSSVLNDVSNMIAFRAKSKDIEFNIDVDENLPDVYFGDEMRMRLIIQNLLTNAVKYTDSGSVDFSVSRAKSEVIKPGSNILLKIVVKDTGIGIKKEDLDKIFRRFERVNLEHNSTIEGTGLGLAIVQLLCSKMGGKINLESEYGKGSTFTLTIPQKVISCEPVGNFREKFEQSIINKAHYHELFKAPDAHILIVDDTNFNLVVAVGLLKKTEIKIDTSLSGADAVALAKECSYDLILMDQRMPEMDGTEALHKIREFDKNTPVICLTADAILGARARYLAEGFTDYLTKPIDSEALEKLLLKYLPKEKIILVKETEEKTTADEASDFIKLKESRIDVEIGLGYSQNDEALYRALLSEYVASSDEKINSLKKFCASEDCRRYAIVVHALKSSSRMIGAKDLSGVCAQLEKSADSGDIETLQNNTPAMLELYEKIISAIKSADIYQEKTHEDDEILEFFPS
ncbi:MAG: ATP-binding protein [Synergistales bacterium]|nr:ATP-binding protein [Synergistales bacterium]MDY6401504.1 ATP-binding protein [Synergistales bacterium]MDY6404611.1 ATP-binding protein [Synergistales bacterium]MDY6410514.1 ATP-binding protein [Synergistales bacterium]MDY6414681.1 ATP-binding protein [Synergistales bacterium]